MIERSAYNCLRPHTDAIVTGMQVTPQGVLSQRRQHDSRRRCLPTSGSCGTAFRAARQRNHALFGDVCDQSPRQTIACEGMRVHRLRSPPRMVPHPHRPALAHRSHVRRNNQTADNRVRELHDTGGARNAACGCRPNPAHAGWSPPRGAASSLNVHAEKKRGRRFKIRYSTTAAIRRNPV